MDEALLAAARNYSAASVMIEEYGQRVIQANDRIFYRCPICNQIRWVARGFQSFVGFTCFQCQWNRIAQGCTPS
ncbi:unnamed protein product [Didymodactylos carnosus]|uniref:Uncharacterized protein n=1 Tax=Didymodactylos carnosus TaxID=1234261 RepID=A0A814UFN5_9BILA|nr:unnamed protein product [Didymodactylos carnosus]CAF1173477.1 unnamed protein product [Didymodactylos carnosus]CAF3827136.1 unnamed protein product [Didymodactylos carnosus]CAF3937351.1 unnamed protein product [Didymodactylos carnosus]